MVCSLIKMLTLCKVLGSANVHYKYKCIFLIYSRIVPYVCLQFICMFALLYVFQLILNKDECRTSRLAIEQVYIYQKFCIGLSWILQYVKRQGV